MLRDQQESEPAPTLSTPKKRTGPVEDDLATPTPATQRVLEEQSGKANKYTGCNCSKSQCLKMYCMCFAVGRVCDKVRLADSDLPVRGVQEPPR